MIAKEPLITTLDQKAISSALDELSKIDESVRDTRERIGDPRPRTRPRGFPTLLQAIVGQQVSTKAAASVWARLCDLLKQEIEPQKLLAFSREDIQAVGLSWRKVDYALGLAEAVENGTLDFTQLQGLSDQNAIKMISALRGFGPWSAEIYLMFAEGREDICPSADLAIQVGYQQLKQLGARPSPKELITFLEPWRPYRSAGCLLLWHLYGSTTLD